MKLVQSVIIFYSIGKIKTIILKLQNNNSYVSNVANKVINNKDCLLLMNKIKIKNLKLNVFFKFKINLKNQINSRKSQRKLLNINNIKIKFRALGYLVLKNS